jgi:hypothetical protein
VDMKIEVVQVPVSDVDRAKDFHSKRLGFNMDVDQVVPAGMRIVQSSPRPAPAAQSSWSRGGQPRPPVSMMQKRLPSVSARTMKSESASYPSQSTRLAPRATRRSTSAA